MQFFDLLDLDLETISDAQAGDLLIEVTMEIMECLDNCAAIKETYVEDVIFDDDMSYTPKENGVKWSEEFAAHLENVAVFEGVVETQEEMASISKRFKEERQNALDDLNQWYTRFNTWLNSPAYQAYNNKPRAWNIYKKGLAEKKKLLKLYTKGGAAAESHYSRWWSLKHCCDATIGDRTWVWPRYFNLIEEDFPKYWSGIDPEEVDEQVVLHQGPGDVANVIGDTHVKEMEEYNRRFKDDPKSLWGFWDNREDYRLRRRQQQDAWYDELAAEFC